MPKTHLRATVAPGPATPDEFSTRSASFAEELARIRRFARDPHVPILIEGESGTGKTTIARYIHRHSPRASGAYQQVVLSNLDDSLASSELFGHVVGAFTDARRARAGQFVSANGGTLFLDEAGKASRAVQQKLLHALECGEIRPVGADRDVRIDVRVVLATNVALDDLMEKGEFLEDLFARVSTFRVALPPLRKRRADIPGLVAASIEKHYVDCGYSLKPAVDGDLMRALERAPWPFNLRQLDAVVHRLLLEADGDEMLTLSHCDADLCFLREAANAGNLTDERVDYAIRTTATGKEAAKALGVHRTTLYRYQEKRRANSARPGTVQDYSA